ncbi:HEAT repeat domain-containing protein [Mucisphaera sp.]|uniref:HEAT repeat domain-containing protein n=1 Tax=Mucisphaera sp. TaxID=2913024 RepID=UPI003D0E6077
MKMNKLSRRVVLLGVLVLAALPGVVFGQLFGGVNRLAPEEVAELRERAIAAVRAASASENPALRMNAIEASHAVPGLSSELVGPLLLDEVVPVRFAALVTVGQLKLEEHALAASDLAIDPDPSVRMAAIFAASENGVEIDRSPLARLVRSPEPGVRGNAALILGMMDDPTAAEMLREAASVPYDRRVVVVQREIVKLQFAEALVKLGDDEALGPIRAAAYSQSDEIRVFAVGMLGPLEDRRMIKLLIAMLEQPPVELQLAAARSLLQMDVPDGLPIVLRALDSAIPTVRAQAAYALGDSDDMVSLVGLSEALSDESALVRLSAAAGVLRRLPTEASVEAVAQR